MAADPLGDKLRLVVDRTVLTKRARAMRRDPTCAEQKLWSVLRGGQLEGLKFRRQVPIGPYIADFACFDPYVIVECDGGQHADSDYDEARDAWFQAEGFTVIRLWNGDVIDNPEAALSEILRRIDELG